MQFVYRHKIARLSALLLLMFAAFFVGGQKTAVAQTDTTVVIANQASGSYTDEKGRTYENLSSVVTVDARIVHSFAVTPDDREPSAEVPQNEQVTRLFTIINTGNQIDTYVVTGASITAPAEVSAWYFDTDNSGTVTPADQRIDVNKTVSPQVPARGSIGVLAVVETNDSAVKSWLMIRLMVRSVADGTRQDSGTIINTVTRNVIITAPDDPAAPAVKLVNNQVNTVAGNGQTLDYSIAFRNRGNIDARQMLVADDLPAELQYIPGTIRLNNQILTDAADGDAGSVNNRRLTVSLARVAPEETVRISFQARVDTIENNRAVVNFAALSGENFSTVNSSPATVVVNPFGTVYNGASAGSAPVAGARLTVSTDANDAPIALPAGSGYAPNQNNQNPFVTDRSGHFTFAPGAEFTGMASAPRVYVLRVEAAGYRPRSIEVTVSKNADSTELFDAELRALDGQPLARAGSFALTNEPVSLENLAALAFNVPLFELSRVAIEKTADRPNAEIGDVVTYRVSVRNPTESALNNFIVRDDLPAAFIYAAGSAQFQNGAGDWRAIEPETAGNSLIFRLPALDAGAQLIVSYRVRVGATARPGVHVNTAIAEAVSIGGETIRTAPAQAPVRINDGAFSTRQIVIGRVYEDLNANGVFDANDVPIADARIYTDKGQAVVTDSAGTYNLPIVEDGALVLALDAVSLPDGYQLIEKKHRRDAGFSRLLRTPLVGGGLLRQNFALRFSGGKPQSKLKSGKAQSNFTKVNYPSNRNTGEVKSRSTRKALPNTSAMPVNSVSPKTTTDKPRGGNAASNLPTKPGTYQLDAVEKIDPIKPGDIEIVSPQNNDVIMTPALEVEARVHADWTVSLTVNDVAVDASSIGVRRQYHAAAVESFTFVGISLRPGANRVIVKAVSPEGRAGIAKELIVMGRGAAKKIEIVTDRKELRANGRDRAKIMVRALDEWNNPALDSQIALTVSDGSLLTETVRQIASSTGNFSGGLSKDKVESGNVVRQQILNLENGIGSARIASGNSPGIAEITAASGNLEVKTRVQFLPELRPTLLVGLAEASFGRAAPDIARNGLDSNFHSRIGFFFRGKVFGKNLLTVAYDSERPLNRTSGRDRLFETDPLERAYPVFGDSSQRFDAAPSNSKLYARLDRGRSYAMFGDFETGLSDLQLAGYSRKLTGAKIHLENSRGDFVSVTGARPDTAFARDVFPGNQLGIAALSHPDILAGSESIVIETRDRRRPEIIVSRERLVRSIDYNIDPLSGQIFFLRPVTAFDANFNLVQAVVTYEHFADGNQSNVYTASASKRFNRLGLRLGFSLVNQRQSDLGAFYLGGFEGEKDTFNGGKLRFEYGMSRGRVAATGNLFGSNDNPDEMKSSDGSAFRVELEQPFRFKQSMLRAGFARSDANFTNPFGATVAPGTERATVSLETKPRNTSELKIGFSDERNRTETVDNARRTVSAEWTEQIGEKLRVRAGYDFRSFIDSAGEASVNSNLFTVGAEWKPTDKLQLAIKREQNFGAADPSYPDQTTIAAKYQVNTLTNIFFSQRLAASAITPISDVAATGFASTAARNETAFGIETKLKRFAALSGRYQIENGINGRDSFAVIGLQNRFALDKKSQLEIGYERGLHLGGKGKSFNSVLLGYSWQNENFRAATRYELRDRINSGSIFTAGAAGKIGDNLTVLGRFQFAAGDFGEQKNKSLQNTAALAWRPLRSDKAALLFSYNGRSNFQDNRKTFERTTDRSDTVSADGLWQANKNLEIYGRFAAKFGSNSRPDLANVSTLTYMTQARAQYKFQKYLDAAVESRFLTQPSSATKRFSTGAELGFWALPEVRLAVGYNLAKTYNPVALPRSEMQRSGFYFNVTTKLSRIFNLFGSSKNKENQDYAEPSLLAQINRPKP